MDPVIAPYEEEVDLLDGIEPGAAPRIRVYSVDRSQVVLGRGSRPEVELDLDACLEDGVLLRRRRGGGCAVLVDPRDVLVAAAIAAPGIGDNLGHFDRLGRWLVKGLARAGLPGIGRAGISDLILGDRKVAGCCIYRRKGRLLYSASLLVDPDLARMERYLRHPPREPGYRGGRSHRDFVGGLAWGASAPPLERFADALRDALGPPPDLSPE